MKTILIFISTWVITTTTVYSQNYENPTVRSTIKLDTILKFEPNRTLKMSFLKKQESFSFFDVSRADYEDFSNYYFNGEELSKRVIPRLRFDENTYIDYTDYIRGCGPLEDGITSTVNSRDILLSNIIDNFVNNYLFKDLLFKN